MAKIVGGAHILDLRPDLLMIRMSGSSQTVTLEPRDLGLEDFGDITMGRSLDVYADEDGKPRYAFSGEELKEPEPPPVVEPPASIDVDHGSDPFNPAIPLPHEETNGD